MERRRARAIKGTHDMARALAGKGYAVFAIDRLGYGDSPYGAPGSGALLTPDGYIEMTHQMVTQIAPAPIPTARGRRWAAAPRVVLSGFSSGPPSSRNATRHHDIDAESSHVLVEPAAALGRLPVARLRRPGAQLAAGKDYVEFFLDGADGYSEFCERFLFYAPGMRGDALEQLCGPVYYAETAFPTPSGEAALPGPRTRSPPSGTLAPPPPSSCFRIGTPPSRGPCIAGRIPTS